VEHTQPSQSGLGSNDISSVVARMILSLRCLLFVASKTSSTICNFGLWDDGVRSPSDLAMPGNVILSFCLDCINKHMVHRVLPFFDCLSKGLTKYDDETFYEDMGVDSTNRRHILILNSDLLKDQRKTREKLIDMAIKELEEEKTSLLDAKKTEILNSQNIRLVKYSENGEFNLSLIT